MNNLNQEYRKNVNDILRLRFSKIFILSVFLIFPIVANLIFNGFYHFNPISYLHSSEYDNRVIMFTLSTGALQIFGFIFMLKYSSRFFIRSGAWMIPLWWVGFNFFLNFTLGWIFTQITKSVEILNTLLLYSQLIFYLILFIIYIKFSKSSVKLFKKTFFTNNYEYNWTSRLLKNRSIFDYYKIIFVPIIFVFIAISISSIIPSSSFHFYSTSLKNENQNGIDKLLQGNIVEKIGAGLLTMVFAPIIEEVVMRNGIILHQAYSKINDEYMDNKVLRGKDFFKPFVFISVLVSIIFFANIHIEYDNFANITSYIIPAIIFVWVYFLGNGNIYYPIATHSLYNIVIFVMFFSK